METQKQIDILTRMGEIVTETTRFNDDEYMLVLSGMKLLDVWRYILSDPTYKHAAHILRSKVVSPYEDNTRIILAMKEAKKRKEQYGNKKKA